MRGQVLVELALVLPVLLFGLLGICEATFLLATQHGYQTAADTIADLAAGTSGTPDPVATQAVLDRFRCDGEPTITLGPGEAVPDVYQVGLSCHYHPVVLASIWDGLPVSVISSAVIR